MEDQTNVVGARPGEAERPQESGVAAFGRSGVYRHRSRPPARQRRGPLGAMSDERLTTAIHSVLAASPFHGEGHRKVWARLRYAGIRTSLRRVLRLMRQNNLLAPTRVGSPRGPRNHDGTIIPDTVDVMWGADLPDHRGTASGLARVSPNLQHHLADRAARLSHPSPVPAQAASNCCHRRVGFNPVSQKPQAVQT